MNVWLKAILVVAIFAIGFSILLAIAEWAGECAGSGGTVVRAPIGYTCIE